LEGNLADFWEFWKEEVFLMAGKYTGVSISSKRMNVATCEVKNIWEIKGGT
jgi:hypothetical protein